MMYRLSPRDNFAGRRRLRSLGIKLWRSHSSYVCAKSSRQQKRAVVDTDMRGIARVVDDASLNHGKLASPSPLSKILIQNRGKSVSFALYHLERITKWQERAEKFSATKSGKTPRRLIELFAAWPTLSAPIAQNQSSSSAPSINRNITALYRAGLIREMIGQTRYRFWTADV